MPKKKHEGVVQRKTKQGKIEYYARVSWTDADGKEHQKEKKGLNVTHAKQLRRDMLLELGRSVDTLQSEKLTFRELAEEFQETKLIEPKYVGNMRIAGLRSWKNQRGFLKPVIKYFSKFHLRRITYEDLISYRTYRFSTATHRGKQRSIAGVNRELALLRTIFKYAVQKRLIPNSPFDSGPNIISLAEEVRRDRILTFEEEKRLLQVCCPPRSHLYYIVILALDTALRKGELLKLKWTDIDFKTDIINIRSTTTKTYRGRKIGMTSRVKSVLQSWRLLNQDSNSILVFGGIKDVKRAFGKACNLAGIENLHIHDLRHTGTTRMIQAGILPTEVMKITGHTQWSTFERYVNVDSQGANRTASLLDTFLKNK